MKRLSRELDIAPGKWKRMFSQALADSIYKTLTEPLTNSWDSYKKLGSLEKSSGLIEGLLSLPEGARVDHRDLIASLKSRKARCQFRIRVCTSKKGTLKKGQCQVIDHAAGLSKDRLGEVMEQYGADKTAGAKGRGLFGQGLSDVLWGHHDGRIVSIKDARYTEVLVGFNEQDKPAWDFGRSGSAIQSIRRSAGIQENGTCIEFSLSEKCRVSEKETFYARLCNFYMLRTITANPRCQIILEQHRSDGIFEEELRYDFPSGIVVKRFSDTISYLNYSPVVVDGFIARADQPLDSDDNLENRENGLLVVDENDAVYDLSLFGFDRVPGLERIFGVIRLTGFREIAYDRLRKHNEAIITETRDGFDGRREFTKLLHQVLKPHLEQCFNTERKKGAEEETEISKEVQNKVERAMNALNSLFTAETGERGEGEGDSELELPEFEEAIFIPSHVTLRAGAPRSVLLLAKSIYVDRKSSVILESKNSNIVINPDSATFTTAREPATGVLALRFGLLSSVPGESGVITALIEGSGGQSIEAELVVADVQLPKEMTVPESGMEFRPSYASVSPHRKGLVVLCLDVERIPPKSEINVRLEDTGNGITLLSPNGTDVTSILHPLSKSDVVAGTKLAKVPINFKGHGKGQSAEISAKVKVKGGDKYTATAEVTIKDVAPSDGGMFRRIDYGPIPSKRLASQFDPIDGTIWINSKHPTNLGFYGDSRSSFNESVEGDRGAQIRLAELILDEAMYHTLAHKHGLTGEKGWAPNSADPVGSIRAQIEAWKYDEGAKVFKALVSDFKLGRGVLSSDEDA